MKQLTGQTAAAICRYFNKREAVELLATTCMPACLNASHACMPLLLFLPALLHRYFNKRDPVEVIEADPELILRAQVRVQGLGFRDEVWAVLRGVGEGEGLPVPARLDLQGDSGGPRAHPEGTGEAALLMTGVARCIGDFAVSAGTFTRVSWQTCV
jgi:hypothetical protein